MISTYNFGDNLSNVYRPRYIAKLSKYEQGLKTGTYGGNAGPKSSIIINGEHWIIKYPKKTNNMKNVDISYTTAPLSEYIGSKIYEILEIDVHKVFLAEHDGYVVVCCKDFCPTNTLALREFASIRNVYLPEIDDTVLVNTPSGISADLETIRYHLKYNPLLNNIEGVVERFWECALIDILINNNDRNNTNWGILHDTESNNLFLAPVYDNGASFYNSLSDEKLSNNLSCADVLNNSALSGMTAYTYKQHKLGFKKFLELDIDELHSAILHLIPIVVDKFSIIEEMISNIPNTTETGIYVCSDIRKKYYIKTMELRINKLFLPLYNNLK